MLRTVLALVVSLAFGSAAAAAQPLEAYGRLPAIEQVELSADGSRVAYIAVAGETRRLVVQELGGDVLASLGAGDHKVRGLQWAGPDHVIILVSLTESFPGSAGRAEQFNAIAVNLKTKGFATLLDADRSATGTRSGGRSGRVARLVMGTPVIGTHNGETAAYVRAFNLEGGTVDLFRVDLDTGKPQLHERATRNTSSLLIEPDGRLVARTEREGEGGKRWRLLLPAGGGWKVLREVEADPLETPGLAGFGRGDGRLLVSKQVDGAWRYVEVGPDGSESAPLDVAGREDAPFYDPYTRRPLGLTWIGDVREFQFFDPKREAAWRSIKRGFPGQQVTLQSWSRDFSKVVVGVDGHKESGAYYLIDVATKRGSEIGLAYPDVPPERVAEQKAVTYKAADGLDIPAYLTLPVGREAKNLPLVVLPHGGPEARDEPGFDWWSQALASRGYAVLQPNYRGSDGYGRKFVEASYGQWGKKMQTDLSDGVRWLAAQGTIDPKRVCIVGASYGGYAALAGATLDADVYRCAVSVAGVSDLPRMMLEEAGTGRTVNNAVRYWSRSMGATLKDREKLAAVSPARLASRAKGPVMLIHGRDDTVVPYSQTTLMVDALKQAGKPYELVTLNGEDHWLSRGETRLRMLAETVRFLEKHNPPN